jgi:outer membrane protein assembly factor BamB
VRGAWLVKVSPTGAVQRADFASLVPGAPAATDLCLTRFRPADRPWPPSPTAEPPSAPCGAQRPGINVAPAIAPDGTIYTISRAHFNGSYGYVVAVNPDLTPRWAASMRDHLNDGCGVLLPFDNSPTGCRTGANFGVDPATNRRPAGQVTDLSSSSPVVAPDGSVLYGAFTNYNGFRGHLMKFSSTGAYQGAYDFGWDTTPAIYEHDGTYSVVIKDNHYFDTPGRPSGPFYIVQLRADLTQEWRYESEITQSCRRNPDGTVTCVDDHPFGFEWCINAPAVDKDGVVYANSEDGHLYRIGQGGTLKDRVFLNLALGAAYTPLSLDAQGRIYTQNAGSLFVVGD